MNYIAKLLLNSLYGRFGMNDDFTYVDIIDKRDYEEFSKNNPENIIDFTEIGEFLLVQSKNMNKYLDNENKTHDVNVSIAASVTAYARIVMSQFKNNPLFNLYYTDTDSIFIDKELDPSFISSTILGKMKLERICNNAIFLAPKVYGLLDQNGQEIIKVKGLGKTALKDVNLNTLESLLINDSSIKFNQNKWFRSIVDANITIKDQLYTLKVTGNKRKLIYDNNNLLINTKPYNINSNKEIIE